MAIHVNASITIDRPVPEVFAFVSDPTNEPEWRSAAAERRQVTDGPIGVGTRLEATDRIAGRSVSSSLEIVGFEHDRLVTAKMSAPWNGTYDIRVGPADGGTLLTYDGTGQPSGVWRIFSLMPAALVRRDVEKELARLKARLERPGG